MDYIAFCRRFYAAAGIPVTLLEKGRPVYSALSRLSAFPSDAGWNMWPSLHNPEFLAQTANLEYGRVRIENTDYDIIIGPLFATPVTEEIVEEFLTDQQTPHADRERIAEMLYSIPLISHHQCLRYLTFLHLCLNGKSIEPDELYDSGAGDETGRIRRELHTSIEAKENGSFRDTYSAERQLYRYVEKGDVDRLKGFWDGLAEFPREGRMANSPLRHAKNMFIRMASGAVIQGAIPGGLDTEKAYQLLEVYSTECEQLQTVGEVRRLQYIMLTDLCRRTGSARIPDGVSAEIAQSVTYIKNHTNESICADDVARHIGRSRSYLYAHFRSEMGVRLNAFITRCKLEEACDFLTYGTASLSEISSFLGFSSQSYFQNVFKKAYGVTPLSYRRQYSRIKGT